MSRGNLREGAWIDAHAGQWAFVDGHGNCVQRPGKLANIGLPGGVRETISQEKGKMSHRHFCDVMGHWFECDGKALRRGDTAPSVCRCDECHLPLEDGDHTHCKNRVELVACPAHREEERRRMEQARKEYERRAAEFGFDEKWARMKALPDGPEKHALAQEIVEWLFGDGDKQQP